MESLSGAYVRLIDALASAAPTVAGFLIAWIAFELQEWRRRETQKRAIRGALRAELESVEVILNNMVTKFAVGSGDLDKALAEFRWLLTEGRKRGRLATYLPGEGADRLRGLSDEDLRRFLQATGWHQESVGVAIPISTVEAVLTSPVAGLSPAEVQTLVQLKWQSHLLQKQAQDTAEGLRLTFTVTDPENHSIAVRNHEEARLWYRRRAEFMLAAVRDALKVAGVA